MAGNIKATQPVTPLLPVKPPMDEQQQQNNNKNKSKKDKHPDDESPSERPHHGLFDEYV